MLMTVVTDWAEMIREEYRALAGLRLTLAQAQRLWGMDELTCLSVLEALVDEGFLGRTAEGTYYREGTPPFLV
jgi:hypothetical protein